MSKPAEPTQATPSILLIVSSYAPNLGGLQGVTRTLARELHGRGFPVSVVTQRYPRTLQAHEEIDGVSVQRLFFLTPQPADLRRGRIDLFLAGLFYFPLTLVGLIMRIASEKPDVVNLHFAGAPTLFVLIAHWVLHFKLVVSLHGDDIEGLAQHGAFHRWITRKILQNADAVTACSHHLLAEAGQVEPSVSGKGHTIHNGIDLPDIPTTGPGEFVCAVGRLVRKKGFDVLLQALARTDKKLRLIGSGPEHRSLQMLAAELKLNGRAEFVHVADREGLLPIMAASRLVIVPSRQEPFGIVALEAMSMGRPVVATRTGGLPEVLEGADAMLVPPDDSLELANAIEKVLARVEQEPDFGKCNRNIAARFSTTRMVDQYAALYCSSVRAN